MSAPADDATNSLMVCTPDAAPPSSRDATLPADADVLVVRHGEAASVPDVPAERRYEIRVGGAEEGAGDADGDGDAGGAVVARVSRADDVAAVGTAVSRWLDEREGDDRPAVVWFDSVTETLASAGDERTFRFLHLFTRCVASAGATGYYRLDPGSDAERRLFGSLFDSVVSAGDGGAIGSTRVEISD